MRLILLAAVIISHYAPGKFEPVIENRLKWGHVTQANVDDAQCFLAARTRAELNTFVWIRRAGWKPRLDPHWRKCLVVDVCGGADGGCAWMDRTGIPYEIDGASMLALSGRLGKGLRVMVSERGPTVNSREKAE